MSTIVEVNSVDYSPSVFRGEPIRVTFEREDGSTLTLHFTSEAYRQLTTNSPPQRLRDGL